MSIMAGKIIDIKRSSGFWIFLDIGFSSKNKSCGLLLDEGTPKQLLYSETVKEIIQEAKKHKRISLLIEAPLSVSFDTQGNPKGRIIEKLGSQQQRYWYVGPGCVVMVATHYLLRNIMDAAIKCEIKLFEGFVSFKDKGKSNHSKDVQLLREVVWSPEKYQNCIYCAEKLQIDKTDKLVSAFTVSKDMNFGVPPVIMR